MVRGFYALGSGILTQNRKLSGITNNLTNMDTTGYKKKVVTSTTFGDMVISRVDAQTKPIGSMSLITAVDKTNVIHSQGTLRSTDRGLDFAIEGEGFFQVQGQNGTVYTRNGSFNLDQQGYLVLNGQGRVMGTNGPIHVGTDQFTADSQGNIAVGGRTVGKLAVYNFADYNNLKISGEGMFTAAGGATLMQNPSLRWKTLEGSNVDASEEMTNLITTQRELQSCSQAIKMFDQVLSRSVTEIGKI
ncbi:MAG TPA: flagellar hook-basal body complex protein [Caproiciproducens sp.]|nr:flagellar hook-basal body complex protein [Caproiciproducens sp.]